MSWDGTTAFGALVDNGSTDTTTRLTWQKCSIGQTWNGRTCTGDFARVNWRQAKSRCEASIVAGYYDWRLPTINELKTLINTNYQPTIDRLFHSRASDYWSFTTNDGQKPGVAGEFL